MQAHAQAPSAGPRAASVKVRLAPELPSLAALGLEGADAAERLLLDPDLPRARLLSNLPLSDPPPSRPVGVERLLLPLPGTPDTPGGAMTSAPQGAGTGWVVLERWRDVPLARLFGLRFGSPRSTSVAERHWNLLCHLRAHGVGTPEPWAVGSRGAGLFARASFLVTRAFDEGTQRLDRFLEDAPTPARVEHAAEAIRVTLRAIGDAGARLPRLDARGLWLQFASHGDEDGDCGLAQIETWREDRALGGLARDPRPAVLVSDVREGSLGRPLAERERRALLEQVMAALPEAGASSALAQRLSGGAL